MKINRKDTLAGYPILKIRDILRLNEKIHVRVIVDELKVDDSNATLVLKTLQDLGYVEQEMNANGWCKLTIQGNALRQARAIPSIDRKKADQIFNDFIKRVQKVNDDENYLYRVTKVILFGSYLKKEVEFVNDLDIVVEYEHKIVDEKKRDEADCEKRIEVQKDKDGKSGKRFRNMVDFYDYSRVEVKEYLQNKNRYIRLHTNSDLNLNTEFQQVYP